MPLTIHELPERPDRIITMGQAPRDVIPNREAKEIAVPVQPVHAQIVNAEMTDSGLVVDVVASERIPEPEQSFTTEPLGEAVKKRRGRPNGHRNLFCFPVRD